MRRRRTIVAAVGQKGVTYGGGHHFPRALLMLVETCKAESYDISRGGMVVSYTASPRGYKMLDQFLSYAEAMREILPDIRIGIAEGFVAARFHRFKRLPVGIRSVVFLEGRIFVGAVA